MKTRGPNRQRTAFGLLDFSKIGLGDCLAAIAVVHYLGKKYPNLFMEKCMVWVPPTILDVSRYLLKEFDVRVSEVIAFSEKSVPGRSLIPRPPRTLVELFQSFGGSKVYVNWAEHYARSGFPYESDRRGLLHNMRFLYSELTQFKTIDWRSIGPIYIGFSILFPLLLQTGDALITHIVAIKNTLPDLRAAMRNYYLSLPASERVFPEEAVVIFPTAASFNAIPAKICSKIALKAKQSIYFAVHKDDPWMDSYRASLKNLVITESVSETLTLINRNFPVFVDGFASHLGQFVKDDLLILYTRDSKERPIHPGAQPRIVQIHPPCAPCVYQLRASAATCPAGFSYCQAFDSISELVHSEIEKGILLQNYHKKGRDFEDVSVFGF